MNDKQDKRQIPIDPPNNGQGTNANFFELHIRSKNKINLDYSEIDFQKGEVSPRLLFKKRKLPEPAPSEKPNSTNAASNLPNFLNEDRNCKTHCKIKQAFENYLDLVQDCYFADGSTEDGEQEDKKGNFSLAPHENSFKFTSLDLLLNPLRHKFVWETWSPYEIALFESCVCKFGKQFVFYEKIIRTKTKDEILSFYYYWKQSKYYKTWKNSRYKRGNKK